MNLRWWGGALATWMLGGVVWAAPPPALSTVRQEIVEDQASEIESPPKVELAESGCDGPHRLTVYSQALFLDRTRPDTVLIQDPLTGGALLRSGQFGFNFEPGWEIGTALRLGRRGGIEFRYFAVDSWSSQQTLQTSIWTFPVDPPLTVIGESNFNTEYAADLHNVEVNGQVRLTHWLTLLAGYRHLGLDESLLFTIDFVDGSTMIRFDTTNDLDGGQLGLELQRMGDRLGLQVRGLAGVFHANSSANFLSGPLSFDGQSEQDAFVGELVVRGMVRLTNHVSLQAGYQFLWLDSAALAPNQVAATQIIQQAIDISHQNSVFFHGAFVGLGVRW